MAHAKHVQHARKNYPQHGIEKGQEYWWWKFRYGGKHYSATRPRRSQLTQSGFLSSLYDIQDDADESPCGFDSFEDDRDQIVSELEGLRDECQGSYDNIPEQLQGASSGETLQTRIDSLEECINELQGISCDYDESDREEGESEEEAKGRIAQAAWEEVTGALGNIDEG